MSGVQANIPLQVNPGAPSVGNALAQYQGIQQIQQTDQQMAGQNVLRQTLGNPANMDPNGNLNRNALAAVGAADPNAFLTLQKNALNAQVQQLHMQEAQVKRYDDIQGIIDPVRTASLQAYQAARDGGMPEDAARDAGQRVLTDGLNDIEKGGFLSEAEKPRLQRKFDPQMFAAKSSEWQQIQAKRRQESRLEAGQAETVRHDLKMEDRQSTLDSRREYGNPTEIEVTKPDGTRATVLAQQDKAGGGWVSADEKRSPIDAANIRTVPQSQNIPLESIAPVAKMIAGYQMPPPSGQGARSLFNVEVMKEVDRINPEYQAARYGEVAQALKSFASGKQGDITRSMNVGISHLDSIDELGRALKTGDTRVINRVANAVKEEFGVPAPVTFDAAKQIVADEIVKAIVGYSGAVNDRESMQAKLNRSNSPKQLLAVTKEFRELMAGQLRGLKKQYEDATGFKSGPFSFDEKLLPQTKRELGMVEGKGGEAAAPAAASTGNIATPTSKAEFDALPAGAKYRKPGDPPDKYRIKP